jgi:excisionase family DNA binding protein
MTAIAAGSALDGVLALSISAAARALGVSRATVYVLLSEHKIGSVKVGKRRLIERAEIERFIAAHRVG